MRVQAVRLTDTWKAVRANHEYPPAITHLLGELVAASTLLAANIKFDGSLVLQIQGDGPIAAGGGVPLRPEPARHRQDARRP